MSNYPADLKYTKEHEWVRISGNRVVVGITHYAQDNLGDVVMVELPSLGSTFKADEVFGSVESPKSVSDLFSPVSGKVVALNSTLEDEPERVNKDCYGQGWMIELELEDTSELDSLLSAEAYEALLSSLD